MDLKVGIIGLGRIGHAFGISPSGDPLCHSEAYAQTAGVTVAWGIDPDDDRRASFATRFPSAATFADGCALSRTFNTELVSVCGPTSTHASGVEAALRAGARVIVCEKPIAPTVQEARVIVASCRAAGCLLVVNYSRRFAPMLTHLRREVSRGALAGPVNGCIRYNGGLVHNGTHWIDLCRALFGDVIAARAFPIDDDVGEDGPRTIEVTFAADRTIVLRGVGGIGYAIGEGEFLGESGVIRFADGGCTVSAVTSAESAVWPGYRTLGVERILTNEGMRGHLAELAQHAVTLARGGGVPRCTGEDGIAAINAAETALRELL